MFDLLGKTVLVCGASGLLGRPLVDKLMERGAFVIGVGYEQRPNDWVDGADYRCVDLSDYAEAEFIFDTITIQSVDCVFHLAGAKGGVGIGRQSAADFMHANIQSTINILTMLDKKRLPRFLFTSSVGAYPGDRNIFVEDQLEAGPPHESDYFGGYAKRFGEILCKAYREQYGLDYVVVRPTSCYGPYDRFDPETGMVIAALIARIEAGENPLRVWGDGQARRDFLYSKDCAEYMIRAMERGRSGEAYNLGTGIATKLDLMVAALSLCYPDLKIEFDATKPSGPSTRQMDMTKSRLELNLPEFTSPIDALLETIDWYRANRNYQKYDPFKK